MIGKGDPRITEYANHIRAGLMPFEVREVMGLSKGLSSALMAAAKRDGLVSGKHDWHKQACDNIAEMVSEGATLTECAAALRVSVQRVSQHWQRIVRELGWQAQ